VIDELSCLQSLQSAFGKRVGSGDHDRDVSQSSRRYCCSFGDICDVHRWLAERPSRMESAATRLLA
jgi:hypothetical protein